MAPPHLLIYPKVTWYRGKDQVHMLTVCFSGPGRASYCLLHFSSPSVFTAKLITQYDQSRTRGKDAFSHLLLLFNEEPLSRNRNQIMRGPVHLIHGAASLSSGTKRLSSVFPVVDVPQVADVTAATLRNGITTGREQRLTLRDHGASGAVGHEGSRRGAGWRPQPPSR